MSDTVSGVVDSVIYQSPDESYTVCELEDDTGAPVTLVGALPLIAEGVRIKAYGEWTSHPTYGRQFKCEYYEQDLPESENDIIRYLSAGNVKGVGPKTALRIVERYGTETFDVMENHPEWLAEISGISQKKAAAIGESFRENAGARSVIMFCKNICSPTMSMRIYKKWGSGAVDRIKRDPYSLCRSIHGIGFGKADELAKSIGLPQDDPSRIEAGLNYILEEEARRGGHTCVEKQMLAVYGEELLCVDREIVLFAIDELIKRHRIVADSTAEGEFVYSPKLYRAEVRIAEKLWELSRMCATVGKGDTEKLIADLEMMSSITFAPMQREAIAAALESGVMILTGGPGTGKTTVTKALISVFEDMGLECALAAPTGRAANRMSEATSHESKTLHRLLETNFVLEGDEEEANFIRGEDNLLEEDVFIIDEVSMIDTALMDSFLRAVKPGARVILIGDADQLPSVGAGNVLADLISADVFRTVRLTEIFRQSEESLIVTNAHAVNRGEMPLSGAKDGDFFVLYRNTDAQVAETVADLCCRRLPATYGTDAASRIQVISPSKKGVAGTEEICRSLQEMLNPCEYGKNEFTVGGTVLREGDRVMQVRNNYSIMWEKGGHTGVGMFNGDIGTVLSIDSASGEVIVDFEGKITTYDITETEELVLSYAVTVHKSQGSEYPIVVIPVYGCHPMLLNRCLLYTAITRAAKLAVIVAKRESLERMVSNDSHAVRRTGLVRRLKRVFCDE